MDFSLDGSIYDPVHRFDILEWFQSDSRKFQLPPLILKNASSISATTVYVTRDFVAPNTATPAATWLATCQTAQDNLETMIPLTPTLSPAFLLA